MMEFIKHNEGGMSVKLYSLDFIKLTMYDPTIVANHRARMNMSLMGVSSLVEKVCCTIMLLNNMSIFRRVVYAQKIEETKLTDRNRDRKRPTVEEPSQTKSKNMFYHQESSMGNKD